MKILYLAHRLPYPPNKGDKIRSFHQLEYLSRCHSLWCACFVDDPDDFQHVDRLRGYCEDLAAFPLDRTVATARALGSLARGRTLTEAYFHTRRMSATVRNWSETVGFDAVLAFSSSVAPYALACNAPRRVIDFCDWDSAKWLAYAHRSSGIRARLFDIEARRLARREAEWIQAFDASVIITDAEAAEVHDPSLRSRITVVGNGVDLRPCVPPPAEPRVGFVGAMDYPPNVDAVCWFVDEVWPVVRQRVPEATFRIVGRRPTAKVKDLADRPGIEVTGEVPNAGTCIDQFAAAVAPLRIARGIQNKVLEAMAAARPVVLTSLAAEGIDACDGRDYVIADGPRATASAVASLLRVPRGAAAIGRSARAFVEEHFNWDREGAKLDALLTTPRPLRTPPATPTVPRPPQPTPVPV
ncbi:MAG TPA: TIGR03087 family PEP-CTERM/XrtA system glycosyltransferase [Phycisphaerae bacterium]|nr:TIGR03087 family PEP-CTERM/XrtA system glycosyltransferase [Phycisphaerae bacterium]